MIEIIPRPWKQLINRVKLHTKQWTRPTTSAIVAGSLSDLTRSRADLIAENATLRQQLIVLKRQVKRPKLIQDGLCWPKSTSVRITCAVISSCGTITADSRTDVLFGHDTLNLPRVCFSLANVVNYIRIVLTAV